MGESRLALDYRRPPAAGHRRAGRTFIAAVTTGLVATGVAFAIGRAGVSAVTLAVVPVVELAKVGLAILARRDRRHAGAASGLMLSVGVALFGYGGLAFVILYSFSR